MRQRQRRGPARAILLHAVLLVPPLRSLLLPAARSSTCLERNASWLERCPRGRTPAGRPVAFDLVLDLVETTRPEAQLAAPLCPSASPETSRRDGRALCFPIAGEVQPRQIQSLPLPWWGLASRLPQQPLWATSPASPSRGTPGIRSGHRHWAPTGLSPLRALFGSAGSWWLRASAWQPEQGQERRRLAVGGLCSFIESLRLEKTSEVTKSNHHPDTPMPAKPCPQGAHPDGVWTPPGMGTPPLPWAAWPKA